MSDIKIYSKIKFVNNNYSAYGVEKGTEGYIIEILESKDGKEVAYEIQVIDNKTNLPSELIFSVKKTDVKEIKLPKFN